MALTPSEKRRQDELYDRGHTGKTNAELDALNVRENADKSSDQIRREIPQRLAIGEPVEKLVATLRRRGHL